MNYFKKIFSLTIIFILCASISSAQSIDDLRSKIAEKNDVIEGLEQEISKYQKEIDALGKEKNSLSNTIKSLDISKKKLEADIKVTENKIASRNIELKELSLQIGDKSERISDSRRVISRSLSDINQANSASAIEAILGRTSFSDLWRNADQLVILQSSMQNKIEDLQSLKTNLEENKKLTEKKRLELVSLTNDLKNQTKIIADTAKQKNDLLKETRNSESSYNSLLALRKAQKEEYEREVLAFEL
jgi:peptidoglycan hydrolase CwlO-like protein